MLTHYKPSPHLPPPKKNNNTKTKSYSQIHLFAPNKLKQLIFCSSLKADITWQISTAYILSILKPLVIDWYQIAYSSLFEMRLHGSHVLNTFSECFVIFYHLYAVRIVYRDTIVAFMCNSCPYGKIRDTNIVYFQAFLNSSVRRPKLAKLYSCLLNTPIHQSKWLTKARAVLE